MTVVFVIHMPFTVNTTLWRKEKNLISYLIFTRGYYMIVSFKRLGINLLFFRDNRALSRHVCQIRRKARNKH